MRSLPWSSPRIHTQKPCKEWTALPCPDAVLSCPVLWKLDSILAWRWRIRAPLSSSVPAHWTSAIESGDRGVGMGGYGRHAWLPLDPLMLACDANKRQALASCKHSCLSSDNSLLSLFRDNREAEQATCRKLSNLIC